MNIVKFIKPQPPQDIEFDMCSVCRCADACVQFPTLNTTEEMDAWAAKCDRVAAERGGFRACDSSIEYGQKADGEYYPMINGVWL